MTRDAHFPGRRHAASPVASALAALRRLPQAATWFRLVTPATFEAAIPAALVLFHHLPALLVAAGIKDALYD
jgi:hypothetical protein